MHEPEQTRHLVKISNGTTSNVRPFQIEWNGRSYTIRSCSRLQSVKKGKTIFTKFLATDGLETFECSVETAIYRALIKDA